MYVLITDRVEALDDHGCSSDIPANRLPCDISILIEGLPLHTDIPAN